MADEGYVLAGVVILGIGAALWYGLLRVTPRNLVPPGELPEALPPIPNVLGTLYQAYTNQPAQRT